MSVLLCNDFSASMLETFLIAVCFVIDGAFFFKPTATAAALDDGTCENTNAEMITGAVGFVVTNAIFRL